MVLNNVLYKLQGAQNSGTGYRIDTMGGTTYRVTNNVLNKLQGVEKGRNDLLGA